MSRTEVETLAQELVNVTELSIVFRNTQRHDERQTLASSSDSYFFIKPFFGMELELREKFFVILMNHGNQVIGIYKASEGGITATVADIRLILAMALNTLATSIIVCHNHPSGNLQPSSADKELTRKLKESAALMDIKLLDHLIVSEYSYTSFADECLM